MASESVENAEKKISKLNSLIIEAKSKGLDVQREELAVWMSKTFLGYAAWDEKTLSLMFISSEHGRLIKKMQKRWLQSLPNSKEMK